jgi:hypothetical protein
MKPDRRIVVVAIKTMVLTTVLVGFIDAAAADVANLLPSKDNTLIEDLNGALSNGKGPGIFSGRTSQASLSIRRAVIAFDVLSFVPEGSTIVSATLRMQMTDTNGGVAAVSLHRLQMSWGEGTSSTPGGKGAPSTPGDATWIHRFYDADPWSAPGGDFEPAPSATTDVDQNGSYIWGSTPEMVADVQSWLDAPTGNHGWILIGDETLPTTVKRFESRESDPNLVNQPVLEVTYVTPCVDPTYTGAGYWHRQCMGVPVDQGGSRRRGRGPGPGAPTEPGFVDTLMPCADVRLAQLGFGDGTCSGIDVRPSGSRCEKALRKLTTLILNVCSGRLQASCPAIGAAEFCVATTVGDRIEELAVMIRAGDCREAIRCAGAPE